MADHVQMISGQQVRHLATVGGNLALCRTGRDRDGAFPSDLAPLLLALCSCALPLLLGLHRLLLLKLLMLIWRKINVLKLDVLKLNVSKLNWL